RRGGVAGAGGPALRSQACFRERCRSCPFRPAGAWRCREAGRRPPAACAARVRPRCPPGLSADAVPADDLVRIDPRRLRSRRAMEFMGAGLGDGSVAEPDLPLPPTDPNAVVAALCPDG